MGATIFTSGFGIGTPSCGSIEILSYLVDLRLANKVRFDLTDSLIDLAIGAARRGVALA